MEKNLIVDINKTTVRLIISDIYYGMFISQIDKVDDKNIPLAAVSVNKSDMTFKLHINSEEWFKLSDEVKYGLLKHEACHLTLFHLLTSDMYPNHMMDNIATDLQINQLINKAYLPSQGVFIEDFKKKYPNLDWKLNAGRDHYYNELNKLPEEEKKKLGIDEKSKHIWSIIDGDGNPCNLTEIEAQALRVQLENTIERIVEDIKDKGSIPGEIDKLIKGFKKPKPVFNYKKYIRNYIGNSTKFFIKSTKLKENQRFPGQPKLTLRPTNKILILIDQSGSVSENELYDFLNEIAHISKTTDLEIRAFDTQVYSPTKYRAGSNEFKRTACGGTSFTAAVNFYNSSKYDTCLIFTDGHAEYPPKCNKNLLWIISSNGNQQSIENHAKWIKIPQ